MSSKREFKCTICDLIFSRKDHLKGHEDSIHKRITYDCKECGKRLARKEQVKRHVDSVHKGIRYK